MLRRVLILIQGGVVAFLLMNVLPAGSTTAAAGPVVVEITDEGYSPSLVTVPPDTTVTWINRGAAPHTVSSDPGGRLDSPVLEPRFSYSYTFHSVGTFPYHDILDPDLSGTVMVAEGAQLSPEPSPAPTPTPTPTPTSTPTADIAPPTPSPTADDTGPDLVTSSPPSNAVTQGAGGPTAVGGLSADRFEGEGAGPEAAPLADSVTVEVGNEWFGSPTFQGNVYEISIPAGYSVRWVVKDGVHNVFECGDNWSQATSCTTAAWSSDAALTAGSSFSYAFDTPGTFFYLCTIHPQTMRGKIVVEAAAGVEDRPADTDTDDQSQEASTKANPSTDAGDSEALNHETAVASEAALPNGGGPPPLSDGMPTKPFFVAAVLALTVSALIFWRWSRMTG